MRTSDHGEYGDDGSSHGSGGYACDETVADLHD